MAAERLFVEVGVDGERSSEDVKGSWDRHRMVEVAGVGCYGFGH